MKREDVYSIISKSTLSQEEVQSVVEEYVYEKKQRRIKINIKNHPIIRMVPSPMLAAPILQNELSMLMEAYNIACEYFFEKQKEEEYDRKESPD